MFHILLEFTSGTIDIYQWHWADFGWALTAASPVCELSHSAPMGIVAV